jgi:transcription termination/antitermination protein NusG
MYDVQGIFANNTLPKWYVLQVYVGFEDAVRKNLELKIKNLAIQDRFQEIYVPVRKVMKKRKDKNKETFQSVEKYEKVYPGYIYVNCVLDKEVGYLIQNTQYISRITGTGDLAVPLEEGYVEKLKLSIEESNESSLVVTINDFRMGDLVKVLDGPFQDMQGNIVGIDSMTSRVNVMLTIFERESNVELSIMEIQKVL